MEEIDHVEIHSVKIFLGLIRCTFKFLKEAGAQAWRCRFRLVRKNLDHYNKKGVTT